MDGTKRAEIIKKIQKLRIMDDFFMTRFFDGNIECTELILRIILDKDDLQVVKVETQATIKSLIGRGARLDVLAVDAEGKHYNIEVQRAKEGADFRRARFNRSMNYEPLKRRSKFLKENEKGANNMCAFTEEMLAEGRAEGRVEGRVEGRAEGRAEGCIEERVAAARRIMQKLNMSPDEAMDFLEIQDADRPVILAVL